jgi:hypothetical protein
MGEIRIYNKEFDSRTVIVEPSGVDYLVPKGAHLSVVTKNSSDIIEIVESKEFIALYFDDANFDDIATSVVVP